VVLVGRETLPGGETYRLTVMLKSGLVRTIYLDAKTYLDRRHTGVLNLPNAGSSTSPSTSTTGATSRA